ncbi:unnamed protein product [Auanema sp. JU1783]|nr:unnamed protein product [Auanema sp. JU1783]
MAGCRASLQILEQFFKTAGAGKTFSKFSGLVRPVYADNGHVKIEFDVTNELTNEMGTLHGGCSATLIDIATTAACMLTSKAAPGVSVNLDVNYMSAAKLGDTVVLEAKVLRIGNTLAYTEGTLFLKNSEKLVAKGMHTKAFP